MSTNVLLRTATVLWIVWGIVHAFAGIMTISPTLQRDGAIEPLEMPRQTTTQR